VDLQEQDVNHYVCTETEKSGDMAVLGSEDGGQVSAESVEEQQVESWVIGPEVWRAS